MSHFCGICFFQFIYTFLTFSCSRFRKFQGKSEWSWRQERIHLQKYKLFLSSHFLILIKYADVGLKRSKTSVGRCKNAKKALNNFFFYWTLYNLCFFFIFKITIILSPSLASDDLRTRIMLNKTDGARKSKTNYNSSSNFCFIVPDKTLRFHFQ